MPGTILADTYEWNGGASSGDWTATNGANWQVSGGFGVPVDGADVVIDDTTPRPTSIVDSGLPGTGIVINTLFLGDGHTLEIEHSIFLTKWLVIEGDVTIDCGAGGLVGLGAYFRICSDQDATLTKLGGSDFEIGRLAG